MRKGFLAALLLPNLTFASIQENSLLHFSENLHSRHGEDGILEELFHRLCTDRGFFVDLRSGGGLRHSITRRLYEKNWHGVFLDDRPAKYIELRINYEDDPNVLILNTPIKYLDKDDKGRFFDVVADEYFKEESIDLLVIHAKGLEYKFLQMLERRPKVIAIETVFGWHPAFRNIVPDHIATLGVRQPLQVINDILLEKGYVPICIGFTSLYIRRGYAKIFPGYEKDLISLWKDAFKYMPQKLQEELEMYRLKTSYIRTREGSMYINLP